MFILSPDWWKWCNVLYVHPSSSPLPQPYQRGYISLHSCVMSYGHFGLGPHHLGRVHSDQPRLGLVPPAPRREHRRALAPLGTAKRFGRERHKVVIVYGGLIVVGHLSQHTPWGPVVQWLKLGAKKDLLVLLLRGDRSGLGKRGGGGGGGSWEGEAIQTSPSTTPPHLGTVRGSDMVLVVEVGLGRRLRR